MSALFICVAQDVILRIRRQTHPAVLSGLTKTESRKLTTCATEREAKLTSKLLTTHCTLKSCGIIFAVLISQLNLTPVLFH